MSSQQTIVKTALPLPLFIRGKVRDTYNLDNRLLIVATDRISVFDVILNEGIPDKGRVLNLISAFWFEKTKHLIDNHLIEVVSAGTLDKYVPAKSKTPYPAYLTGRSMVVKKAQRISLEWVMRGYLSGSAWEEYQNSGTISGMKMPAGLKESQELPEVLFTPTTKADTGHDMPITMNDVRGIVGESLTREMQEKSLSVYDFALEHARTRGIIIADTKMEFGLEDGKLILIDELLTPDSSRFWDADKYKVGRSQPSFDKQPVRDWTAATGWNKEPPPPSLSPEVIEATTARYREAYRRITGEELR